MQDYDIVSFAVLSITRRILLHFSRNSFMQGIVELPHYFIGPLYGPYCSRLPTQTNTVESMYRRNESKGCLDRFEIDCLRTGHSAPSKLLPRSPFCALAYLD